MKKAIFGVIVAAAIGSPVHAAGLKMSIGNGYVSIDAQDVTVGEILREWAKLGKTRIINLEGVASGPITVRLDNVPENVALDIILRTLPGYMAAPRSTFVADASQYDRILIMASSPSLGAARAGAGAAAGANFSPANNFPQPPAFQPAAGFPGGQPNITQLSGPNTLVPGMSQPPVDDPMNDPALAAAAAAGLLPVPAPMPGAPVLNPGARMMPDPAAAVPGANPAGAAPANPFNVPAGASRPGLAPPPPPMQVPPDMGIRRPPQADR